MISTHGSAKSRENWSHTEWVYRISPSCCGEDWFPSGIWRLATFRRRAGIFHFAIETSASTSIPRYHSDMVLLRRTMTFTQFNFILPLFKLNLCANFQGKQEQFFQGWSDERIFSRIVSSAFFSETLQEVKHSDIVLHVRRGRNRREGGTWGGKGKR